MVDIGNFSMLVFEAAHHTARKISEGRGRNDRKEGIIVRIFYRFAT